MLGNDVTAQVRWREQFFRLGDANQDLTGAHTSAVSGGSGFGRNSPLSTESLAWPLVAAKSGVGSLYSSERWDSLPRN